MEQPLHPQRVGRDSRYGAKSNTFEMISRFHNIRYAIIVCNGILEMRHIGRLEMRQSSPLGMLVQRQQWEARSATCIVAEVILVRSRHVLFDCHVAERIASP